jgi:Flp pilus assembly protein TadD
MSPRANTGLQGIRIQPKAIVLALLVVVVVIVSACSNWADPAKKAENSGDYKSAIAVYRDRLTQYADDPVAIKGLAADLYMMGTFDEALPMQEKQVALDPKDAQTRVELAFNYLNHQNEPSKAVVVLTQAAALEPTAQYLTFLAQAQIAMGDAKGAEATLHRAVTKDASYGHSYEVLATLLENEGRAAEAAQILEAAKSAKSGDATAQAAETHTQ